MTGETRIRELLEEILKSGRTPEDVCAECPELLPVVESRLRQIQRLDQWIETLFPPQAPLRTPQSFDQGKSLQAHNRPVPSRIIDWLERSAVRASQHPIAAAVLALLLLAVFGAILIGSSLWRFWNH